jgi:hypothetical protein
MADEARRHFCVDRTRQQSYREHPVDAIRHPSAVSPRRGALQADALRARLSALSTINRFDRAHRAIDAFDFKSTRSGVGVTPRPRSSSSARRHQVGALRAHSTASETSAASSQGVPMEYVEHADPKPEPIPIARCRELLGKDGESMTDQDVEHIHRHAETMACIVVAMYEEHCRLPE